MEDAPFAGMIARKEKRNDLIGGNGSVPQGRPRIFNDASPREFGIKETA
jgi:hypothetical protein